MGLGSDDFPKFQGVKTLRFAAVNLPGCIDLISHQKIASNASTNERHFFQPFWDSLIYITWNAKCPIFKAIVAGFRGKVA